MSGASSNCWAIKWLRPLGWHQNDAGVHAFDRYPTRLRRNDRADALARWLDERPPVSGVLPFVPCLSINKKFLIIDKHLETLIRIKPHILVNVSINKKFLIIDKHLETLIRIAQTISLVTT